MKNPWNYKAPDYYPKWVKEFGPTTVEDRLDVLKSFDTSKLRDVIAWPGTQKTVRAKAQICLRQRGIDVNKSGS